MASANHPTNPILRDPAEQEVSPLELLFDLVFVLGVSQRTQHLVANATWRGAAETLVLYLPMFAVWLYTSWAATLYSLSHPRARRMMIAVMAAGLFLNASLTRAFADAAWVFVASLLAIQLGRTAWMLSTRLDPINHDHFRRTLAWLVVAAPLWIAGAALSAHVRLVMWGAAAAIDLTGTWLAHPVPRRQLHSERLEFGGEHLMERCRLFLLIALGETVVTPAPALVTAAAVVAVLSALVAVPCSTRAGVTRWPRRTHPPFAVCRTALRSSGDERQAAWSAAARSSALASTVSGTVTMSRPSRFTT